MTIPARIRVEHIDDYHTAHIGHGPDGTRFMAFLAATVPPGPMQDDWRTSKRWYAVLHVFDASGVHLRTEHTFVGTTADGEAKVLQQARERRDAMVAALGHATGGELTRGDVEVALFATTIEGHVFGLVDTTDEEHGPRVTLLPQGFVFTPPWDGLFDAGDVELRVVRAEAGARARGMR